MQKKIPLRQCKGCREMKPKKDLVRVVLSPEGTVSMDLTGKKNGRGVYVCRDIACLRRAMRTKALSRELETEIPEEVYSQLEAEMEAAQ